MAEMWIDRPGLMRGCGVLYASSVLTTNRIIGRATANTEVVVLQAGAGGRKFGGHLPGIWGRPVEFGQERVATGSLKWYGIFIGEFCFFVGALMGQWMAVDGVGSRDTDFAMEAI